MAVKLEQTYEELDTIIRFFILTKALPHLSKLYQQFTMFIDTSISHFRKRYDGKHIFYLRKEQLHN